MYLLNYMFLYELRFTTAYVWSTTKNTILERKLYSFLMVLNTYLNRLSIPRGTFIHIMFDLAGTLAEQVEYNKSYTYLYLLALPLSHSV